jgi:hypothetical protein
MKEELITEIQDLIRQAEVCGERPVLVEHYQTLLNYHIACLDTLACDIMGTNQQLAIRKETQSNE